MTFDQEFDPDHVLVDLFRQQEEIQGIQRDLVATVVIGRSFEGLVAVRTRGTGEVLGVDIHPRALRYQAHVVGEMVTEAFRDARARSTALSREKFSRVLPDDAVLDSIFDPDAGSGERETSGSFPKY
jgi:DNA-binding protein YbaB